MSKSKLPANWQTQWIPLWNAVCQIGEHNFKNQWDEECLELHKHYTECFQPLIDGGHFTDDKASPLICIPHNLRFGYFLAEQWIPDLLLQYEDSQTIKFLPEDKAKKIALREWRKMAYSAFQSWPNDAIEAHIIGTLQEDHHIIVASKENTLMFNKLYELITQAAYDEKLICAGIQDDGNNVIIAPEFWLNAHMQVDFFQETLSVNELCWTKLKLKPDSLDKFTGCKNKVGAPPSDNKDKWIAELIKIATENPELNNKALHEAIHRQMGTWQKYLNKKYTERCPPSESSVQKERSKLIEERKLPPRG